jgi:hypothetical protein
MTDAEALTATTVTILRLGLYEALEDLVRTELVPTDGRGGGRDDYGRGAPSYAAPMRDDRGYSNRY